MSPGMVREADEVVGRQGKHRSSTCFFEADWTWEFCHEHLLHFYAFACTLVVWIIFGKYIFISEAKIIKM